MAPTTRQGPPRSSGPLVIAQVDAPNQGQGGDLYYRTLAPGRAMAALPGTYVINLDNIQRRKQEVLLAADVVVFNGLCDPDLLPIVKERREQRLLTLFEINDDPTTAPRWNPAYSFFHKRENLMTYRRLAHSCDAIQYSSAELHSVHGYLNPCGQLFPNQITHHRSPRRHKAASADALIVGWGGSLGHIEDMAVIAAPLMEWVESRQDVQLHIMAAAPILQLFARLPEARKRLVGPGPIEAYFDFVGSLDVGLAPLQDTPYNRARSDVKFLEYAAQGVVPVVQAIPPYRDSVQEGRTGFCFRAPADLLALLDKLAADRSLLLEVAAGAHRYVVANRLQQDHGEDRLHFYRDRLAELEHRPRTEAECASLFTQIAGRAGAEVAGRHIFLHHTPFEDQLYKGMVLCEKGGRPADALQYFQRAASLEPDDYQPAVCLGAAAQEQAADALTDALRKNPKSIQAWIALGMHHVRRGAADSGISCFLSATELFPQSEVAYTCAAHALRALGAHDEALRFEGYAKGLLQQLLPSS